MSQFDRLRRIFGLGRSNEPSNQRPDERRKNDRVDAQRGLRVLVIDDSRTVVAALSHMLKKTGYAPLGARDGETGLEIAFNEQPDLIFLDIVMPGINGFAALRQLRKDERTAKIPVIMISGNPQAAETFYLERIGADDFMKKPFGRAEVFSRIEKLVRSGALPARSAGEPMDEVLSEDEETRISDNMPSTGEIFPKGR